jgi:hypothetical protein
MNRFSRVKNFVRNHQFGVGMGTGVVGMFALLVIMKPDQMGTIYRVAVTPEQLQTLIDKPESVIAFDCNPLKVWVLNSASKDLVS